jgi:hypothetical protein
MGNFLSIKFKKLKDQIVLETSVDPQPAAQAAARQVKWANYSLHLDTV